MSIIINQSIIIMIRLVIVDIIEPYRMLRFAINHASYLIVINYIEPLLAFYDDVNSNDNLNSKRRGEPEGR